MATSGGRLARLVRSSTARQLDGFDPPDPRLTLVIPDPDEHYVRAAADGATIVREPRSGTE